MSLFSSVSPKYCSASFLPVATTHFLWAFYLTDCRNVYKIASQLILSQQCYLVFIILTIVLKLHQCYYKYTLDWPCYCQQCYVRFQRIIQRLECLHRPVNQMAMRLKNMSYERSCRCFTRKRQPKWRHYLSSDI